MIKEKNLQSEHVGVVIFPKRSEITGRGELCSSKCNILKHNGTNCKNLC
jgi:hypothetical protein